MPMKSQKVMQVIPPVPGVLVQPMNVQGLQENREMQGQGCLAGGCSGQERFQDLFWAVASASQQAASSL